MDPEPARSDRTPFAGVALRIAVVLVVAGALFFAYRAGLFARFADPRSLARLLVESGGWGYLAFVLAYACLQPFGVPGTVFVVAAPLIWPWPVAFALSMVGTMAASVVGFSFARFVAGDWFSKRIPARFRKYDDALEKHAFRTVFVLRLVFWMPQLLHAFLGVSKVPFWTHFWGSVAGYALPLFVVSYFGAQLFDADGNLGPRALPIMGGLAVFSALVMIVLRIVGKREARREARSA